MRISMPAAVAAAIVLTSCAPSADFDPQDPAVIAEIDAIVNEAMAGARDADVDRVLAMAGGEADLTFITGDIMLTGLETIRAAFTDTYAGVESQSQEIFDWSITVLSPDVAILTATAEGTYTDKAGWTADPVGLGHTMIFVRGSDGWRLRHAHQSIAH